MSKFRRGVVAAFVLWVASMSVAAAVRQAHADGPGDDAPVWPADHPRGP